MCEEPRGRVVVRLCAFEAPKLTPVLSSEGRETADPTLGVISLGLRVGPMRAARIL